MELRQYAGIAWKWAWLIVLCMALAGGSAYLMSKRQVPQYEATVTLLINQASSVALQDYTSLVTGERLAMTYAQLLTKRPVIDEVVRTLNLPPEAGVGGITVKPVPNTQLITLQVVNDDPALAKEVANTLPVVFSRQNEELQQKRYSGSKQNLQQEMEVVDADIAATQASLDALRATPNADQSQVARLTDALLQYRTTYSNLVRSYEEIRLAEARTMDTVTVVEPAAFAVPVGPGTVTNTLLAMVVGAMVAVGVAFLIEYLDDTVKSPDDVQRTAQLATFGSIVDFHQFSPDGVGPIAAARPKSSIAEGYRMLRTNLEFSAMGMGQPCAVILVTSAQPQEGKTTSLANLGVSLAQAGKRVVLVDTDLRRPSLHQQFALSNEVGLSNLLLEREASLEFVVQPTRVPGLRVLTSGRLPANPAEVLAFPETTALLQRLRGLADYVLLDSPPVLSVADASILAQKVDGVLLVAEMGRTRRDVFLRSVAALQAVKAHLMGVVLNKVSSRPGGYYYDYYYYHHYTDDEEERKDGRGAKRPRRSWLARLLGRRTPDSAAGAPVQALPPTVAARSNTMPGASTRTVVALDRPLDSAPARPVTQPRPKHHRTRRPGWLRWVLVVIAVLVVLAALGLFLLYQGWLTLPSATTDVQGYINQGRAFFMVERYEDAAKYFGKAVELVPQNSEASLGLQKAQQYIQIRDLYVEANNLVEQNLCSAAISKLETVVNLDPWYRDAGILLARCRRFQELDVSYEKAMAYYTSSDWVRAAGAFESIRNKDPTYRAADVKSMLVNCYLQDGTQRISAASSASEVLEAAQSFSNALALFPDSAALQEEKQLVSLYRDGYLAYSQTRWSESITSFTAILNVRPDYANGRMMQLLCDCRVKLGDVYQSNGQWLKALEQYRAVFDLPRCNQAAAQQREQQVLRLMPSPTATPGLR